jgi:hypothetical protein
LDLRRGTAIEPVVRITVFTPDRRRQPAILPDLGFGEMEKKTIEKHRGEEYERTSVGKAESSAANAATTGSSTKGSGDSKTTTPRAESFAVHGRIVSVDRGELLVQVPANPFVKSTNLKVTVAHDADIDVELVGVQVLSLVQPGDHIQASGNQLGEGLGRADRLTFRSEQRLDAVASPKKSRSMSTP